MALAFHAALAVALAFCLSCAPSPDELSKLDLTSIDLSFAETEAESVPVVASTPVRAVTLDRVPPVDAKSVRVPPVDAKSVRVPPPDTILPDVREPSFFPPAAPRPQSAPRQARIDALPKPRRNIRPDYPRESRLRGEQGDVSLEIDVAADGTVSDVRILKSPGFPLLDEAAVKAARAARFTPAKSDGESVASIARLTLTFKLK